MQIVRATSPPSKLIIDTGVTELVLTGFIRDEITKVGCQRAVIGLSDGVDSPLACYLAAKALGPENVLALHLPYPAASPDSLSQAEAALDDLGIQSETVDLTPAADALFAAGGEVSAVRQGSLLARLRMVVLYDRAVAWNALVVGTSNKTELLLGHGTIHGDLAVALQPLGDLFETQVRQLAQAMGVLPAMVEKPPISDVMPGQSDYNEQEFTTEVVDRLLYLLVDERYSPEDAVAAGFEPAFVDRVMALMRRSHYKRTLPVIPKMSGRSIGHDFRYLRDWGT